VAPEIAPLGETLFLKPGTIAAQDLPVTCASFARFIRLDSALVEPEFVYWWLQYLYETRQLLAFHTQHTGVSRFQWTTCSHSIVVPSLDRSLQRKVGAILSTYDNLIENNSLRIRLVEEMAQRTYREWFVDFRYPGHENVPLMGSELGPIPDGWSLRSLSELVGTQYGYTESATTDPVGPHFLRGMDINKTSYVDWSTVPYCPIDASDHAKYRLSRGDVVVIRMADPGKVGIVETDVNAVFASYLIRVRPLDELVVPYFLFYFMSSDRYQAFVTGASTGTTRKSLSAPLITSISLAVPPPQLQHAFVNRVTALRYLMTQLIRARANLRATRDLLLPRLVSGEVDVTDLDIAMPEAAV
jgi:type I restriction enzyme S subunit